MDQLWLRANRAQACPAGICYDECLMYVLQDGIVRLIRARWMPCTTLDAQYILHHCHLL